MFSLLISRTRTRLFRVRTLLTCLILLIVGSCVYFIVFDYMYWHQKNILLDRTYEKKKVCFGDSNEKENSTTSTLISAIIRHMQEEQSRTKYKSEDVVVGAYSTYADSNSIVDFQHITDTDDPEKLYLYSAHFDQETQSIKLIGGAKNGRSSLELFCQYYDHEQQFLTSHAGYIQQVEDVWRRGVSYAGSFVVCPIHPTDCTIPSYVSVTSALPNLGFPSNLFHINYEGIKEPTLDFALCVQPAFEFEEPLQFLEWIEFYKLMGVQAFTFYNVSIGPITTCLMNAYKEEESGISVQILNWTPVFINDVEISVNGQVIQLNDCIYRYRGRAKYMANVDYDEMIVPNTGDNFKELFQQIQNGLELEQNPHSDQISAFAFRNGFFYKNEFLNEDDGKERTDNSTDSKKTDDFDQQFEDKVKKNLVISKFIREKDLFPAFERTKFIAVPKLVRKAGVHYLIESKPGTSMYVVPPELAYLHHYRKYDDNKVKSRTFSERDIQNSKDRVLEKSAGRFRNILATIVSTKLRQFAQRCALDLLHLLNF